MSKPRRGAITASLISRKKVFGAVTANKTVEFERET